MLGQIRQILMSHLVLQIADLCITSLVKDNFAKRVLSAEMSWQ
jgi:hypothetical protein